MRGSGNNTICRLCLNISVKLVGVFDPKGILGSTAADVIKELLQLPVSEGDRYPKCICVECFRKLEDFKEYKIRCEWMKYLWEHAHAGNGGYGILEFFEGSVLYSSGIPDELILKEDNMDVSSEDYPVDLNEGGAPMNEEIGDSRNCPNLASSDGGIEKDDQAINPLGKEFDDHLMTSETDQNYTGLYSSEMAANFDEYFHDMNYHVGNGYEESDYCIPTESLSYECFGEDIPRIGWDKPAESEENESFDITPRNEEFSDPIDDISDHTYATPTLGNVGATSSSIDEQTIENVAGGIKLDSTESGIREPLSPCVEAVTCLSSVPVQGEMSAPTAEIPSNCSEGSRINISSDLVDEKYEFKECGEEYLSDVYIHTEMDLEDDSVPLKCSDCNKVFCWKGGLEKHMDKHSVKKSFECDVCDREFTRNRNLTRHMKVHTGDRKVKHPIHNESIGRKCELREHIAIQYAEKSFKCSKCDKVFNQKSNLTRHMKIHFGGELNRIECPEDFNRKVDLEKHITKHSVDDSFICSRCGDVYDLKCKLTRHMKLHLKEKSFR